MFPDGIAQLTTPRPLRIATWFSLWLCISLICGSCVSLWAQVTKDSEIPPAEQILASYEGQAVTSVDIAGRPDLKVDQFMPDIDQKAGQPFAKEKIDATVAALKTAGKFENVRVKVDPEADGVRVLFVIEPAVYYGMFEFPAPAGFPYSRLVQVANYTSQAPYNATEVEQNRQSLVRFFQEAGYFQAQVTTELKIDSRHGIASVVFRSNLGPKAKFGSIDINGLPPSETSDMQHRLTTIMARARGAAIRNGKTYNRSTLNKASNYIQSRLGKEGFLAAQVKLQGAEYHADTNRADVQFNVSPGAKTNVEIAGAHIWPWTKKSLLPEYQGVGVNEETLQEGQQALTSYYQAKGCFM